MIPRGIDWSPHCALLPPLPFPLCLRPRLRLCFLGPRHLFVWWWVVVLFSKGGLFWGGSGLLRRWDWCLLLCSLPQKQFSGVTNSFTLNTLASLDCGLKVEGWMDVVQVFGDRVGFFSGRIEDWGLSRWEKCKLRLASQVFRLCEVFVCTANWPH